MEKLIKTQIRNHVESLSGDEFTLEPYTGFIDTMGMRVHYECEVFVKDHDQVTVVLLELTMVEPLNDCENLTQEAKDFIDAESVRICGEPYIW